jgi:uncharacterized damage-inducible protein DinB
MREATHVAYRLKRATERRNLLDHPFYRAWTAGTLTGEDLAFYSTQYWRQVELETAAFLESLSAEQLEVWIVDRPEWGDMSRYLWEMMMHVVNHGTQHRSEVAMKLTNFGHSPGYMDQIFFFLEEADDGSAQAGN